MVIRSRASDGEGDACGISGVAFDNFTINGKRVGRDEMVVEGPVTDLRIQ